MSKPFFLPSKFEANQRSKCDDCGDRLQGTDWFWNPNKRARIKRLCAGCKADRDEKKAKQFEAHQDRLRGARMPEL